LFRSSFECEGGKVSIGDGNVRGEFEPTRYQEGRDFRDLVHRAVTNRFLAQQVQTHEHFDLSAAAMTCEHADGRRDVTAFIEPLALKLSVGQIDVVLTDAQGNIVQDTKAERLAKQEKFRTDVADLLPADLTLKRMLQSFNTALRDKDNLFIHLYEIREALTSEFGDGRQARETINLSQSQWSRFGRLANEDPLQEGRHRGNHVTLRRATS